MSENADRYSQAYQIIHALTQKIQTQMQRIIDAAPAATNGGWKRATLRDKEYDRPLLNLVDWPSGNDMYQSIIQWQRDRLNLNKYWESVPDPEKVALKPPESLD